MAAPLTCSLHPDLPFTGFCPSCLRDRLLSLEPLTSTTSRNSTSTISSSLKSILTSLQPQLRRSKSFSFSRHPPLLSLEPHRKSADVRSRHTLQSLFHQDDVTLTLTTTTTTTETGASGEIDLVADEITIEETNADVIDEDLEPEAKPPTPPPPPPPPPLQPQPSRSFWIAASVFSKKLRMWRRKQKLKKMKKQEEKSSRRLRETQSEVGDDAFGRRSCDLDPRFSLDAGRISFDDPRYSFEEPRASWDGYLVGIRSGFPRLPPMLSVLEDAPVPTLVQRSDGLIPVEEDSGIFYSDSLPRSQRASLDRSSSVRNSSFEITQVSPEFWSSNSMKNDRCQSFESTFREDCSYKRKKKSKRWSIWGLIHRLSRGGDNVESWPELGMGGFYGNGKVSRSNSNMSSRSSVYGNGVGFGSVRNSRESNGIGKKRRDEFVLRRNRSSRYNSDEVVDDGRLKFYGTPMRGSRSRRGSGVRYSRDNTSFARNLY